MKKPLKKKKHNKTLLEYGLGGDIGAGLTGVLSGVAGSILPGQLGSMASTGINKLGETIQGPLSNQEKSIRGYGQAAGALGTGIVTGGSTLTNSIDDIGSGLGQGISTGSPNSKLAQGVGTGLNVAGNVGGMFMGNKPKIAPMGMDVDIPPMAKNGGMMYPNGGTVTGNTYNDSLKMYNAGENQRKAFEALNYRPIPKGKSTEVSATDYFNNNMGNSMINPDIYPIPNSPNIAPINVVNYQAPYDPKNPSALRNKQPIPVYKKPIEPMKTAVSFLKHGGMINQDDNNPNAQLEKQEVMKYPNGGTDQVNAPTHDNGGINLNLPQGTQIFSDHLKDPDTKKTFAKVAEKYKNNRWDKIMKDDKSDDLTKKTASMMKQKNEQALNSLFEKQEQMKEQKMMKYGGKLGYKMGGEIPMFWSGGTAKGSVTSYLPKYKIGAKTGYEFDTTPIQDDGNFNFSLSDTNISESDMNKIVPKKEYGDSNIFSNSNFNNKFSSPSSNWWDKNKSNVATGIGAASNLLGPLAYLTGPDKGVTKQDFYGYTPEAYDPTESIRQARQTGTDVQAQIRRTSGDAGLMNTSLIASQDKTNQAISGIQSEYDNKNVGGRNAGQQYNIGNRYNTDDINMRRSDQALNRKYQALYNIGEAGAGIAKDFKAQDLYDQEAALTPEIYKSKEYQDFWKKSRYNKTK